MRHVLALVGRFPVAMCYHGGSLEMFDKKEEKKNGRNLLLQLSAGVGFGFDGWFVR